MHTTSIIENRGEPSQIKPSHSTAHTPKFITPSQPDKSCCLAVKTLATLKLALIALPTGLAQTRFAPGLLKFKDFGKGR
ncbi:MAG: hypothetical protein AAF921_04550 [Cyanobacteria bacterium P01_D01_bin.44]